MNSPLSALLAFSILKVFCTNKIALPCLTDFTQLQPFHYHLLQSSFSADHSGSGNLFPFCLKEPYAAPELLFWWSAAAETEVVMWPISQLHLKTERHGITSPCYVTKENGATS